MNQWRLGELALPMAYWQRLSGESRSFLPMRNTTRSTLPSRSSVPRRATPGQKCLWNLSKKPLP